MLIDTSFNFYIFSLFMYYYNQSIDNVRKSTLHLKLLIKVPDIAMLRK